MNKKIIVTVLITLASVCFILSAIIPIIMNNSYDKGYEDGREFQSFIYKIDNNESHLMVMLNGEMININSTNMPEWLTLQQMERTWIEKLKFSILGQGDVDE